MIGATTTKTGLKVECALDPRTYEKGIKVRDAEMQALDITGDAFHPEWNYTDQAPPDPPNRSSYCSGCPKMIRGRSYFKLATSSAHRKIEAGRPIACQTVRKLGLTGFTNSRRHIRIGYGAHFRLRTRPTSASARPVDDYVGSDNPARFIDAFVDGLDLVEAGFGRVQPKATGRPGYAPGDLLKLYIYGYLNHVVRAADWRPNAIATSRSSGCCER